MTIDDQPSEAAQPGGAAVNAITWADLVEEFSLRASKYIETQAAYTGDNRVTDASAGLGQSLDLLPDHRPV